MPDSAAVITDAGTPSMAASASVETRESWVAACVTLGLLSVSYGSPLLVIVGLKPITADLHTSRSVVALAASMTWLGTGLGGILMGWIADRVGIRTTVIFGAVMMALGLSVSTAGGIWGLYIGHALLLGLLGNGAVYPPLVIYVSRRFDRRRGTALALISSGQYIAGVVWPVVFERGIAAYGWRATMLAFAALVAVTTVPIAAFLLPSRARAQPLAAAPAARSSGHVLGLRPAAVQVLLCAAAFLCCVPMSVPQGHLVAFCSDVGIPATQGAAMLSLMLGCAFVSRQFWGWLADRIGGVRTVLTGSALQALAITAFLTTQDEAGLFVIAAAFGLGFSGIIPAYVLAVREFFPSSEAAWRVPTVLLFGMSGMAFGGWFAGALYDGYGFYAPAFASGALFNLANLAVIGFLVLRQHRYPRARFAPA